MDAQNILSNAAPFKARYDLIEEDQSVNDIMNEVVDAHKVFARDYDSIALLFDAGTTLEICKKISRFCKQNFTYKEQTEKKQMTMSPAAMMNLNGEIDCKNYAGFCSGILDALNRLRNKKISWSYRFASYKFWEKSPHHVFIVVKDGNDDIWFDPTPGAANMSPVWQTDQKVKVGNMALYRVSGIPAPGKVQPINELLNNTPTDSALYNAIQLLLQYSVMNTKAQVSDKILLSWQKKLPPEEYDRLVEARKVLQSAAIGGLFDGIMFFTAQVSMWAPRRAFLGLVALNGFGLASKLFDCIFTDATATTYYQPGQDKIYQKWRHLGGSFDQLVKAVKDGKKNKPVLGASAVVIAAWAAACATIISALGAAISAVLKNRKQQTGIDYEINPATGLPYGQTPALPPPSGSDGIMGFIEDNALIILAAAAAYVYFKDKDKKQPAAA